MSDGDGHHRRAGEGDDPRHQLDHADILMRAGRASVAYALARSGP